MGNINVFTHYTHKIAFEAGLRAKRKRSFPRLSPPWLLALAGAILCAGLSWGAPAQERCAIVATGAAWGYLLAWGRQRLGKFSRALRGLPLAEDDVAALRNRPK